MGNPLVVVLVLFLAERIGAFKLLTPRFIQSTKLQCIDFDLIPVEKPEGAFRADTDESWKTPKSTVIPFKVELGSLKRPELITFEAKGVLIEPSQSIGRWYREALNTACEMKIRLPKPKLFTKAFNKAYEEMCVAEPCFGAKSGMTCENWWLAVVTRTYKETELLDGCIDKDDLDSIMPEIFEMLYTTVFSTKEGWTVKEDVLYTLQKLVEWRDQGSGPRIGVVSNMDDRLALILADLDLTKYFDFVSTSYETKQEKPDRGLFDSALSLAKLPFSSAATSYHIGPSIDTDVIGASAAGWSSFRYNPWFDEEFPDWYAIETDDEADQGAESRKQLLEWGRRDLARPGVSPDAKDGSCLEWVDLWGLDDVLHMFGFPEDPTKPIRTTYIRNVLDDE